MKRAFVLSLCLFAFAIGCATGGGGFRYPPRFEGQSLRLKWHMEDIAAKLQWEVPEDVRLIYIAGERKFKDFWCYWDPRDNQWVGDLTGNGEARLCYDPATENVADVVLEHAAWHLMIDHNAPCADPHPPQYKPHMSSLGRHYWR